MPNLNFVPFPELITERLLLRQLTPGDAQEIYTLRSDEGINKFIDRLKAVSIADAFDFIAKINDKIINNEGVFWAIALKNNPVLIGTICYWNFLKEDNSAEIGYEMLTAFHGRGIMQEAIEKIIHFGFDNMQLERITAFSHRDNDSSIRLLENNNFTRNEKPEQKTIHDDVDLVVSYTLSRPDYIY
ncbi:MAG: GNAT family N-acetyltransferase [Ferruginibacter sp.]